MTAPASLLPTDPVPVDPLTGLDRADLFAQCDAYAAAGLLHPADEGRRRARGLPLIDRLKPRTNHG